MIRDAPQEGIPPPPGDIIAEPGRKLGTPAEEAPRRGTNSRQAAIITSVETVAPRPRQHRAPSSAANATIQKTRARRHTPTATAQIPRLQACLAASLCADARMWCDVCASRAAAMVPWSYAAGDSPPVAACK
ncbi:hypothetical protein DL768_004197 [Monosporascus sp. mg162]|nr:hypothetical protein DL768_004197 [Monosporascus sp. mg162]